MCNSKPGVAILSPLAENHITAVVDIHSRAFLGYMSTRLGKGYLTCFYRWFSARSDAISIIAEVDCQVVGFVVGAPLGYEAGMSRNLFWPVTLSILTHPWLLGGKDIRATIIERGRKILGKKTQHQVSPGLPEPTMSLVGIGVFPRAQGLGIGKKLIRAFERESSERSMKSMRLSVYPENQAARHLYESTGWQACTGRLLPGQAMYYSKILA